MLDRYDSIEFDTVEYLASSGGLSCPDSDARISYMQLSGYPQLEFNGGSTINGAGTDAINGSVYDPVIQSMLDDPTPVKMSITDHSFVTGSAFVTVDMELEGDLPPSGIMKLRVALLEDDLLYGSTPYHNVLRDMLPDVNLEIDTNGETQSVTIPITMSPTWDAANLRAVAFVQNDVDREILQSCNTQPTPRFSMRYFASGPRTVVSGRSHTFDETGLFNYGTHPDTYTVTLDTSGIPGDGSAYFIYLGEQFTTTTISLDPGQRAMFNVVIDNGSGTQGQALLTLHANSGGPSDRQLEYKMISGDTEVLIVDDDGAYDYESLYFIPALAGTGKSHATWDRTSTVLDGPTLANFDIVIWNCGWAFPTVDATDRAAISEYLDGGGNLFITGQDIGWDMYEQDFSVRTWYNTYLHAIYVSDDTNDLTLDGVAGTFTEGMALNIGGGDGANNQDYPSDIDPSDEFSTEIFTYSAGSNGGIMADTGTHRVVYFAFGFEAINNAADRAAVMEGIIGFLGGNAAPVGDGALPGAMALLGNTPNPFNPQTEISFFLASDSLVKLEVFDLRGHLVRTLEDGPRPAGQNEVKWDGRDDGGREVPSGGYFYRLTGSQETLTDKMMLVR